MNILPREKEGGGPSLGDAAGRLDAFLNAPVHFVSAEMV